MHRFGTEAAIARIANRLSIQFDRAMHDSAANEKLRMVWSHARIGTVIATAFAILLALMLRGSAAAASVVDAWLAVKVSVAAVRIWQGWRYRRAGQPGGRRWRLATHALLALDGAVWGVAGFALTGGPMTVASLVAASLACVACVATFGLQVSMRATAAYVVPILAPTAAGLLLRADEFGSFGGTGLLMLLGLQLVTAARSQKRVVEGVLLRLRAETLATEKDAALKLALRQSAVKTQFLANMSHELRTPLHGILGIARLLHLEAHDSAVLRRVELIEQSGTHLLRLINDLLDVSRHDAGQLVLHDERFDFVEQLRQVASIHALHAEEKGLDFTLSIALEPRHLVVGDPARLRQVLHNLLGNAIKFTHRGSIGLEAGPGDAPDAVRIVVRDTGDGIDESEPPHIFEAFRQSTAAHGRPTEGAGLGLTIAREIALAMGGNIVASSAPGAGTTMVFTARLPRTPAGDTAVAPDEGAAAAAATLAPERTRLVLLAEDDDVNALIATSYLDHFGLATERVRDGKEAVRHALREFNRPQLVLMDCRMPVMDGLAATREIRTQERTLGLPHVPVIALTATAAAIDREECLAAGMDDFLSKPFSGDELARALECWIACRPAAAHGAR
jgi:signal transduction histidine kinase/CheY-like chemotaxis protein